MRRFRTAIISRVSERDQAGPESERASFERPEGVEEADGAEGFEEAVAEAGGPEEAVAEASVIDALPRSRPHRRSARREARPPAAGGAADTHREHEQPPPRSSSALSAPALACTVIMAGAELTEIALSAGARAIRNLIARFPGPD